MNVTQRSCWEVDVPRLYPGLVRDLPPFSDSHPALHPLAKCPGMGEALAKACQHAANSLNGSATWDAEARMRMDAASMRRHAEPIAAETD
jgi:hypothetical protein